MLNARLPARLPPPSAPQYCCVVCARNVQLENLAHHLLSRGHMSKVSGRLRVLQQAASPNKRPRLQ